MAVSLASRSEVHTTIGERAHMLMWRQKLNQTQVGQQIGVDQAALSKKLRGERPWYAHEVLGISAVLGTTHTTAQDMLDRGASLREVQFALGHNTSRSTELYLRREPPGLRDAMEGRRYAA